MSDRILILDFGSQVTQLIARRVRESGVYCEIHPFTVAEDQVRDFAPRGDHPVGRAGLVDRGRLAARARCRLSARRAGARHLLRHADDVRAARRQGRRRATIRNSAAPLSTSLGECRLFDGLWPKGAREQVWMSHGDRVDALPPGFRSVASSEGAPYRRDRR